MVVGDWLFVGGGGGMNEFLTPHPPCRENLELIWWSCLTNKARSTGFPYLTSAYVSLQISNLQSSPNAPLLQSRTCNKPSVPTKRERTIHPCCHLSVITQHKGTVQPKICILANSQDLYLSTTSNVNILSAQHPTSEYCLIVGPSTRPGQGSL